MSALLQLLGGVGIGLGLIGTWMAGQWRTGWLVCIVSSVLWLPTMVTGEQWAAVLNVGLSIAICARNFRAGGRAEEPAAASSPTPAEVAPAVAEPVAQIVLPRQTTRETVGTWS